MLAAIEETINGMPALSQRDITQKLQAWGEGKREILDEALRRLAEIDEQAVRVAELRFFSALSVEETAALGISPATVKRDWQMAKAWLRREPGQ